ncbi:MAG: hypothetical protein H3C35_10675 [Bacteroidetes bacterium]|nr:hypothetical protein [Bacteroidota bacterium]
MHKYILFSFLVILLFTNADCKKDIVTPEDIKPGSRNYTWTVDTVYAPYNLFSDLTGNSPTDLWAASSGDGEKIFYHYDGIKWTTDFIPRQFSPASIFSLSPTSVWSGGMRGEIWHYDGINWLRQYKHLISGYNEGTANIIFEDICAFSESDIYFIGQYLNDTTRTGLIVHFNGSSWKQIKIPNIRTTFGKMRKHINGKFYFSGLTNEQFTESTYQLYEFDRTTLEQIKSGLQNNDEFGSILPLGNKIYFIIGYDFFDYLNGQFMKMAHLSNSPNFLNAGIGRNIIDIFLLFSDGIAHYNGTDVQYLFRFSERIAITDWQIFEKDIFVVGQDTKGNNLIFHGNLNK